MEKAFEFAFFYIIVGFQEWSQAEMIQTLIHYQDISLRVYLYPEVPRVIYEEVYGQLCPSFIVVHFDIRLIIIMSITGQ